MTPARGTRRARRAYSPADHERSATPLLPSSTYDLPEAAYTWIPTPDPGNVKNYYIDAVDKRPHDVSEAAVRQVDAMEDEIAVAVCKADSTAFQRLDNEILADIRAAARPYIEELAHVATVYKKIFRWSRDACIAARQNAIPQLERTLRELAGFVQEARDDGRFREFAAAVPLGQVVRSFNVHAARCAGRVRQLRVDPQDEEIDVVPVPPPRVDAEV